MADFDPFGDDYGDLFITQQSREYSSVSLEDDDEESMGFKTVLDPQYLDISDFEEDACEK